ncbi:hypothetical protein [Streptomyces virginiae]
MPDVRCPTAAPGPPDDATVGVVQVHLSGPGGLERPARPDPAG